MVNVVSGIKLPDSQIAREATELVRQHEPEILFNHSVRVYVFGALKGTRQNIRRTTNKRGSSLTSRGGA
jgi:hypothetical protein